MSLNSLGSILTIMYMAAELLIGLIPLMFYKRKKAASEAVLSLNLRSVKKDSGTSLRILGRAYCTNELGWSKIIECFPRLSMTLSKYPLLL